MAATSNVLRSLKGKIPITRKFSNARIRSIIKHYAKTNRKVVIRKKVNIMIFLSYMLFLQKLAQRVKEAACEDRDSSLNRTHIEKVAQDVLDECQG